MDLKKGSRIAVIGAGISGIAAANILKKNGFVPVVFEKHESLVPFLRLDPPGPRGELSFGVPHAPQADVAPVCGLVDVLRWQLVSV